MYDHVTFTTHLKNDKKKIYNNSICFAGMRWGNDSVEDIKYIDLKLLCHDYNEQYKDWWLKLLCEIEPRLSILSEDKVRLEAYDNYYKNVFILSLVRNLWGYNTNLISLAHQIFEKKPDLDKLHGVIMAASFTQSKNRNHCICAPGINLLKTAVEFQNAEFDKSVQIFTKQAGYDRIKGHKIVTNFYKNEKSIDFIFKHFGVSKTYKK